MSLILFLFLFFVFFLMVTMLQSILFGYEYKISEKKNKKKDYLMNASDHIRRGGFFLP